MPARRRSDDKGSPLGNALRDARLAAGLNQIPAADRVDGLNQVRLSRIETGAAIPPPEMVAALLDVYGVHGDERRRIEALTATQEKVQDRRLIVQRGTTAALQARWLRMSRDSRLIRAFHPAVVLGPLQTPGYASVIVPDNPAWLETRIAQGVEHSAAHHVLIQTEGALRCTVGSAEVMAGQLAHLIEVSHLPNVQLGVIPAAREMQPCPAGFHLYEGERFSYAVIGLEVATATLDGEEDVAFFSALFDRLAAVAVWGDEAREVLEGIAEDYRSR